MNPDDELKLAVYRHIAATGAPPDPAEGARIGGVTQAQLKEGYARLAARRLLVLEPDGVTIRMAPPFSGVPTQHRVRADGVSYFANCAWDALGIPAALKRPAEVTSRCEQT